MPPAYPSCLRLGHSFGVRATVGDFTDWKDHDSYRKAFHRLLRDLKAED